MVDEDDESEVVVVLVEMKIVVLMSVEIVVDEVMNEKVTEMGHGGGVGR